MSKQNLYTAKFKLSVAKFAGENGERETGRLFDIPI